MRQHSGDTQPPESQWPHPGARGLRLETAQEAGPCRWPTQQCLHPPATAFSRKPKETSEGRAPPQGSRGAAQVCCCLRPRDHSEDHRAG